ncbi:MAG TPA: dienelactone hydrolase family protein [Planctomycetota bacterium]|nr:dienelactone hydrolase family protein [Planctomycetota bacterium]
MRRSRHALWAGIELCAVAGLAAAGAAAENPRKLKSDPSQEYYVYLPKDFDAKRACWLFVAVHGLGGDGKGALGWESFADEGQCIVVGPSFKGTFQFPSKGAGDKMKAIIRELAKGYTLEHKAFVTGFSAGAQFAHRFALDNPALVAGCAAHSAGDWDGLPDAKARSVPFLVTCGTDDNKSPDRLAGAKKFVTAIKAKGFKVESKWFDGVGHSFCNEGRELTKEFYWTTTTGMTAARRQAAEAGLTKAEGAVKEGKYAEAAADLKKVMAARPAHRYAERAEALTTQIEDAGKERLAKADEQAKTDADGAKAELQKIEEEFAGTRVAAGAARRLATLQGTPAEPPKKQPETPKKETAKTAHQLRSWLAMAKSYLANGKNGLARQCLQKIIAADAASDQAAEARVLLQGL